MIDGLDLMGSASRYLRAHPEELLRMARNSAALKFGLPVAFFRYLINELVEDASAGEIQISAEPPGLRLGATFEKMQTRVRAAAVIYVKQIRITGSEIRMELSLEQVHLRVLSDKKTTLSALIKSAALDISNLGDLINELPGIPSFIVEAEGNRVVIDLMKSPRLVRNPVLREVVGALSSLITIRTVETRQQHLDLAFHLLPRGTDAAVSSVRRGMRSLMTNGSRRRLSAWASRF